jgi:ubiquilin
MNPMMMQQMMGAGFPQAAADTRPPREKYAEQLQQIKEMGFIDEDVILEMLVKTNGNVQLALENLFSQIGGGN